MAKKDEPTDAQLLSRLRRSRQPRTAASLGTTAARLRSLEGVVEAGRVKTGKAGRPAILFAAAREYGDSVNPVDEGGAPEAAAAEGYAEAQADNVDREPQEEAVDHDRLDPSAASRSDDPDTNLSTVDAGERDRV